MRDIYNETDKKIREAMETKEKNERGKENWPIMTNLELQEAIENKKNDVLYIEKGLFKRLGNQDLKKLEKKHLSFVIVEKTREPSFRDRLKVGVMNRISGKEEYIESVAINVYQAILEVEPKTEEERSLQEKLLRKVNKYIHEIGDSDGKRSSGELKEMER